MKAKLTLEDGRTIDMELTPEQAKAIELKKKGRWRAEKWDDYYFITTSWSDKPYGFIDWIGEEWSDFDNYMFSSGNYYQSREEAQFALERQIFITKVNDRIDELNDGWKPDISNNDSKYYIFIQRDWLKTSCIVSTNDWIILKYMMSLSIAQTIISEFGDDLKKYIFTNN